MYYKITMYIYAYIYIYVYIYIYDIYDLCNIYNLLYIDGIYMCVTTCSEEQKSMAVVNNIKDQYHLML